MVQIDILQVGVNAVAAGFGMGISNELYHAWREYRKLLKQRLLDDTIAAIAYYRATKERERYTNLARSAKTPVINPIVRTSRPMPVKPTPVHRIAIFRPKFEPKITMRQATVTPTEEPPLTYVVPERFSDKRMEKLVEPFKKMADWESAGQPQEQTIF